MTLKAQLEGFAALVASLTGLKPVAEANSPVKVIDPLKKGRIEFHVIGCKPVNSVSDEIIEVYDPGTNTLIVSSWGLRNLTIQVKFIGYDHRFSQDALFYLERLGDRIVWPASSATLKALGLVLVTRGSFINLSKVISAEDRQGSVGAKEFIFRATVSEEMTGDDSPSSWIETVEFASDTLDNEAGVPLAAQISGSVTRP